MNFRPYAVKFDGARHRLEAGARPDQYGLNAGCLGQEMLQRQLRGDARQQTDLRNPAAITQRGQRLRKCLRADNLDHKIGPRPPVSFFIAAPHSGSDL